MAIDNRRYYEEFSASYERHRHDGYHAFIDELEAEIAGRYLAESATLLEAGCGTGLVLSRLRPRARQVFGVDLSRGMLAQARRRELEVVQASVTSLPFADASFDLVCSFKVLAHVEAIERAIAEMARVLRPGGYLVAEFYNARSLRYLIKRLKPPTPTSKDYHDEAVFTRYDTLPRIRSYLPSGLTVEAVHGIRVMTPLPQLHKLPVIAPVLQTIERRAASLPVLRNLGGFLIVVARKTP